MESHELIKALKEGKGLKKKHYYNHFPEEVVGIEFLFYDSKHKYFERKGYASAIGTTEQRLVEIMDNPDVWEISLPISEGEWLTIECL